jgi:hypothetical protein
MPGHLVRVAGYRRRAFDYHDNPLAADDGWAAAASTDSEGTVAAVAWFATVLGTDIV